MLFTKLLEGQGLLIESGAHLVTNGSVGLVINDGNFTNNGGFNQSTESTIYMKGSVASNNAKINGTGGAGFTNIVIDKTSNGVQLERTIFCWENIQLLNGDLDLNGQTIYLLNFGTISNETANNRIWGDSGQIILTTNLNAPTNVNPGNLGMNISSTDNLGTFTIWRMHGTQSINGNNSTDRQYKIKYFNTGLNIDYELQYFDTELNGMNENYIDSWRHNMEWEQRNADAIDRSSNLVQLNGASETDTLWALSTGKLQVSAKVLLEGNYAGNGLMNDNLRANNLIPLMEPYTSLGYNHVGSGGETISSSIFNTTGDNAIVDWLFLEVRDPADSTMVKQTVVALLQKDGDIVDLDGTSPLSISNLGPDNYYLVIRHRNHLAVRSSAKMFLNPDGSSYDFSSSLAQAWDKSTVTSNDAMSNNGDVFLLHRADNNGDGFINILDFILSKSNSTPNQSNIYLSNDINMDGNTNILDFILTKSESSPNKSAHID